MRPKGGTDFETLTALYRQIFSYLQFVSRGQGGLDGKGLSQADPAAVERAVERELAAALESVFPRIGLKSFVLLGAEEKRLQLEELARIVTGIRLFNREQGKGGAGLDHVEDAVATTVSDLREALDAEVAEQHEVCTRYQETLVYCHLRKPEEATAENLERWARNWPIGGSTAPTSRRLRRTRRARGAWRRSATPSRRRWMNCRAWSAARGGAKEHVYPKFDAVAAAWFALDEELRVVESRVAVLEELHAFRESYAATLGPHSAVSRQARLEGPPIQDEAAPSPDKPEDKPEEDPEDFDDLPQGDEGGPVRLSVETTPEFMQLPLEYQGFCGWTCAKKGGLLPAGQARAGRRAVPRRALRLRVGRGAAGLLQGPGGRAGVVEAATKRPELVHLLRLQDQYPGTSIAKILAAAASKRAAPARRRRGAAHGAGRRRRGAAGAAGHEGRRLRDAITFRREEHGPFLRV